jgi:Ca2+-binding RTX toxin-like protein
VNPYDQMVRTAYNDGDAGTTNDDQLGWTFTKTHTSGSNTYTHKVHVLFQDSYTGATLGNSQVTALNANTMTVNARTVYDYPTYSMTAGVDNAILFEDSGYTSFYNFLAGDDFVILRDGNLDVVLGAGDDFAAVSGNVGEAVVIGGTGNDSVGLYGLIGVNGQQSDWVFSTMDVATARTVFANKYALNPTANPFEIELSASGLEVVTVAQRYEDGTTWDAVARKYTGRGEVLQTVYLQAETVSSADSGDVTVDSLYGSRDFSANVSSAGTFNFYGRRGTEDSLTITLADGNALATAMSNINNWFVTNTYTQPTLNGSVLSGSHVSTINAGLMGVAGATAFYNMVDLEKITLRGGSEQVTIRLAGSNGYVSVADAVNAADYKDVIFIAKTIETSSTNPNLLNSVANQTTIDIPAGLGIVFEPVTASTAYKVNITDQMVADAPVNADRLVYLLGRQNIDVNGSVLSDMIVGNQGNNVIYGAGGNDVIYGGGGNDTIFGQAGNDLLIGSAGNDFLNGGTGDDTLVTYGTKRTSSAAFDRNNMIGGSGHDDFIFLNGQGSSVMYGGSGEDGYTIMPGWENGLNRIGTTAQQEAVNGVATVLDYSTTADFIAGKNLGSGAPENYLASVNLTFNQLVSPPRPLGSSYESMTFANGTTMQANADSFTISTQTNLGSLLEDYGLMNDVTEYRLHQAA